MVRTSRPKNLKKDFPPISRVRARYLRISPQKLNLVAREVRGRKVEEAERRLKFLVKKASPIILKALKSALASAALKSIKKKPLFISRLEVGSGPTLKRGRPVSRGSFHPILKRTASLLLELQEVEDGTES